jgi:hypothetical protein
LLRGTFPNGLATVALSVDSTQKVGRKSTLVETTVISSEKREPNERTGEKSENEEREKEGRGREVVNNHHVHAKFISATPRKLTLMCFALQSALSICVVPRGKSWSIRIPSIAYYFFTMIIVASYTVRFWVTKPGYLNVDSRDFVFQERKL